MYVVFSSFREQIDTTVIKALLRTGKNNREFFKKQGNRLIIIRIFTFRKCIKPEKHVEKINFRVVANNDDMLARPSSRTTLLCRKN